MNDNTNKEKKYTIECIEMVYEFFGKISLSGRKAQDNNNFSKDFKHGYSVCCVDSAFSLAELLSEIKHGKYTGLREAIENCDNELLKKEFSNVK